MRVDKQTFDNWASQLVGMEACMEELKFRFQLRMLEKFRSASPEEREQINAIMDNYDLFMEELLIVAGNTEKNINTDPNETEETRL